MRGEAPPRPPLHAGPQLMEPRRHHAQLGFRTPDGDQTRAGAADCSSVRVLWSDG